DPRESTSLLVVVSPTAHAANKRIYPGTALRRALRERSAAGPLGGRFVDMQINEHAPVPSLAERRLGEVAAERGVDAVDLMLDLALASDLETRFRMAVLNTDPAIVAELLAGPSVTLGLSAAGAHASPLCDDCPP